MSPDARAVMQVSAGRRNALVYLSWAYIAFVIYGSLVPLDFQYRSWDNAWQAFMNIPYLNLGIDSRADWVANAVLYVPVGFLIATLFKRFGTPHAVVLAFVGSLLFSFALAVSVEFTQLFFPPRTVSLNDIIAEFLGSILGAVVAVRWSNRFMSLLSTLAGNPDRLVARLLKAYAIAYVAFSLFPYDFLVSVSEIEWKLHSDEWGWLVATASMNGGSVLTLAKLFAEVLAVVPLGLMLDRMTPEQRPFSPSRALFFGALLGLLIESAQFFIATGVSQGLSVLTRAMGMYLGALLWHHRALYPPQRVAFGLRRFGLLVGAIYLISLAAVNGLIGYRWMGIDYAMKALQDIHFLPFYYHYYTTEQAALLSLVSVCLMYAPIGVLSWAYWRPPMLAMSMAMLAAGFMESGKLFLADFHPDPTNLLIAGFFAWATAKMVNRIATTSSVRVTRRRTATPSRSGSLGDEAEVTSVRVAEINDRKPDTSAVASLRRPSWAGSIVLIAAFACVGLCVANFPVQPVALGLLLAGYAALIWYRTQFIPVVVPVALALFDLAPWSGRFYFDEFDLLLLTSVAVAFVRLPPAPRHGIRDRLFVFLVALLGLSYAIGTFRGLLPWRMPVVNEFTSYYSPYNALRVVKGVLWALILYRLFGRLSSIGHNVRRLFALGMIVGLAGTVVVIGWERFVFPGMFNFTDVYRVTGPFSQMHTGGADIETYLTLSTPFLIVLLFEGRSWVTRLFGAALLAGATYGLMVTFSRIGYAAYGIALAMALLLAMTKPDNRMRIWFFRRGMAVFVLAALVLAVAVPIFEGSFAQKRLSRSGSDLGVRWAHWSDALQMRDAGLNTSLFGMGLGRYPETYYWRSREGRAATYRLGAETGNTFLRLEKGGQLYIEQFVAIKPRHDYVLSLNARSDQANAQVSISICEKWLLTSARCVSQSIDVTGNGRWLPVSVHLQSGDVGSGPWYAARPVKLSIYNSGDQLMDVDNMRLLTTDGRDLLTNGDFSRGMDRWFFTVDNYGQWHVDSLPVQVLFDQGWLGVVALSLFVVAGLWRAARDAWRGDAMAGAMLASSIGFLVIGSLDSLVDSPRLLMLFMLLVLFCSRGGSEHELKVQAKLS